MAQNTSGTDVATVTPRIHPFLLSRFLSWRGSRPPQIEGRFSPDSAYRRREPRTRPPKLNLKVLPSWLLTACFVVSTSSAGLVAYWPFNDAATSGLMQPAAVS
jgi:hypothetical protein